MLSGACEKRDQPESASTERPAAESEPTGDAPEDKARADSALRTLGENPAAQPMTISVQVDDGKGASGVIGPDGGTVTVTGAEGTRFTLDIPRQALLRDTLIEMTPITSLSGLKFSGGLVGAVQLEPDGLMLAAPAFLTIEPALTVPLKDQVAFGSHGDGQGVHLAPLTLESDRLRLQLLHFSINGVVKTALGAILFEGASVKWVDGYWPVPKTPNDRFWQEFSKAVKEQQILREAGYDLDGPEATAAWKRAAERVKAAKFLYAQDVARRFRAMQADCSDRQKAGQALMEYMEFRRLPQLIGETDERESSLDRLASSVIRRCKAEAVDRCRAGEVLGGINMVAYQRTYQLLDMGDAYTDAEWSVLELCQPKWKGVITYTHSVDLGAENLDGEWVDRHLGLAPRDAGIADGKDELKVSYDLWGPWGGWSGSGRYAGSDHCQEVKSSIAGGGGAKLSISDARTGESWDPRADEALPGVSVEIRRDGSYSVAMSSGDLVGTTFYDSKNVKQCGPSSKTEGNTFQFGYTAKGQLDPSNAQGISGRENLTHDGVTATVTWDLRYDAKGKDK